MTTKKKQSDRPAPPVTIPVPEYVTTCSMPYEMRVVDLAETDFASCSEVTKIARMRLEFNGPMEFLVAWFHEAFETAKMESQVEWKSHEELDRAAHVAAEWALALILAQ